MAIVEKDIEGGCQPITAANHLRSQSKGNMNKYLPNFPWGEDDILLSDRSSIDDDAPRREESSGSITVPNFGPSNGGDVNPYLPRNLEDESDLSLYETVVVDHKPLTQTDGRGNFGTVPENVKRKWDFVLSGLESVKYIYSAALLIFCVTAITTGIFNRQTIGYAEYGFPPIFAFFFFWSLHSWLALMEGGQGCLVGLQSIDKEKYRESHSRSFKNTTLVHRGDNLERFIVGRQFLVVVVIFLMNLCGGSTPGATLFNLPQVFTTIFLDNGVAMMITTIVIGQMTSQINAAVCMLDFINNYFMLMTTYVSLGIELSGILHSTYLVQILFSKLTGKPIESNEPPRSLIQRIIFWIRVLMSTTILTFALVVTLHALSDGGSGLDGLSGVTSIIMFFLLMCIIGIMEGTQIAAFELVNMPIEELQHHSIAYTNCQLMFDGQNLQAFLIGRQIFVVSLMFLVARISSISTDDEDYAIFGASTGAQRFYSTGILGAIVVTILGSLAWRIVASSYPLLFMSNPAIYVIVKICLIIEFSGICSASWVLARFHKLIIGYQPDEVYLEGAQRQTSDPVTIIDKNVDRTVNILRYTISLVLLVFCVIVVMAGIFNSQTISYVEYELPPVITFFLFWFLICWLAMMEGGQGCLIRLHPVDRDKYEDSHPKSVWNTTIVHEGNNLERFIVGRQCLVVVVIFLINLCVGAAKDAPFWGLPSGIIDIFFHTGVAMIITTVVIGQLTSQVNAASCMLDFINNYFMVMTTYVSLLIEVSGLLHSVYLLQIGFSKITGNKVESNEPPRNLVQNIVFWLRVLMSTTILVFSLAVTLQAFIDGNSGVWDDSSTAASVVIFYFLLCIVGILEGTQIAAFKLVNMSIEELQYHPIAHANCQLVFADQNLQSFLIGRQIFVTSLMFIIARIVSINSDDKDYNIFGASPSFQQFYNTGILGALVLTIIGSLVWRIIASSFPLIFMSNPVINVIVRICLIIDASGICSAPWVLARLQKIFIGYQPDEVYLEGKEKHTSNPVTQRDKDIDITITVIKYIYSFALVILCVTVVMSAIFTRQTGLSKNVAPIFVFFLLWALIFWLAMMEGGQGCLIGLQSIDKAKYAESHPRTLKNTALAHKGNTMDRFIVGRQFLVVLVIFLINMCGSPEEGASVLGFNPLLNNIFLGNGVAMMITTIVIGGLTSQINAAVCMLDFINNYFMLLTTYVSLGIEFSGLLHSVYLVQIGFSKLAGKEVESNEPPRSCAGNAFFWFRVLISSSILAFAFAVTLQALFDGNSGMWDSVPAPVSVVIFFLLLCIVGLMEGMQIAAFTLLNMPEEELSQHGVASANCKLMFAGQNLQAFLVGRQIFVASLTFIVARIATIDLPTEANNIFGVPDLFQAFFNTGLLGAIILSIVGSLAWRIVASSFPLVFMSNPAIFVIIRICLVLEGTGIFSASWLLATIHKGLVNYQEDEVYLGKNEGKSEDEKRNFLSES